MAWAGNPLTEPFRSALSPHEVFRLETMECQARSAVAQAHRAYHEGRLEDAARWDAHAETLLVELEHRLEGISEDLDPSEGFEETREGHPPDPHDYLAAQYAEFIAGRSPHFRDWTELARHLRAYLEEYGWLAEMTGTVEVTASDEAILEAAKDAYEAKLERRQRMGRKKQNPPLVLGPDDVFVKTSSHRARERAFRALGYAPQTYYNLWRRRTAATSYFVVPKAEFEKIKAIKGVSRARIKQGEEWRPTVRFANPSEREVERVVDRAQAGGFRAPSAGGLADGRLASDFPRDALVRGSLVELEHTRDPQMAMRIAMDHLTERLDYYALLEQLERRPNPSWQVDGMTIVTDFDADGTWSYEIFVQGDPSPVESVDDFPTEDAAIREAMRALGKLGDHHYTKQGYKAWRTPDYEDYSSSVWWFPPDATLDNVENVTLVDEAGCVTEWIFVDQNEWAIREVCPDGVHSRRLAPAIAQDLFQNQPHAESTGDQEDFEAAFDDIVPRKRAVANPEIRRYRLVDAQGRSYEWTEAELEDTLFESEHWENKKKKVRAMKPGAKVRAGGEVLERLPNPGPRPEDFNAWITFVILAVVGLMGEADTLLREHESSIHRVASFLRKTRPVKLQKLWRGLLLEPGYQVRSGHVRRDKTRTFVSYSENRDVACWFASRETIISADVVAARPSVRGYLEAVAKPDPSRLLWHHSWRTVSLGGQELPLTLLARHAARAYSFDPRQFDWALRTQSEVILAQSPARTFTVHPAEDCPAPDELDARFAFPPMLAQHLRRAR